MMYPIHLLPANMDVASRRQLRRTIEAVGLRMAALTVPNIEVNIAVASAQMWRHTLDLLQGIIPGRRYWRTQPS
jgi:hypothetical protein